MALIGTYGEIESIQCRVEPKISTAKDGEASFLEPDDKLVNAWAFPDNCPRGPRFDPEKALGCIVCVQAVVGYKA